MSMSGWSPQPGSLGNILNGLFGNAGQPYSDASDIFSQYFPQLQGYQQPFYQAGVNAIPGYENWLQGMQNPSGFINNLMGQYQESPYAKYQQQQGIRTAQNLGSATGLAGSTPLQLQAQQNAQNISSQDMNTWLQNVLGINTQYGAGLGNLMSQGQGSANSLSSALQNYMNSQAGLAYGQGAAGQGQLGGLFSGIGGLFGL